MSVFAVVLSAVTVAVADRDRRVDVVVVKKERPPVDLAVVANAAVSSLLLATATAAMEQDEGTNMIALFYV